MEDKKYEFVDGFVDEFKQPSEIEHYWGVKVDKEREGDFSLGICITRDAYYGEFYVYLNLFKWSISIGRLMRLEEE